MRDTFQNLYGLMHTSPDEKNTKTSLFSRAKINLGLHILRKRSDGYHDLSTVFHPIGWADRIEAYHAEQISMTCTDDSLSSGNDNLVIRAAELLRKAANTNQGAHLHLEKIVPYGAGLGGGSSNAATVLHMLCVLWKLDRTSARLDSLALQLGSDVPFFLQNSMAYAKGRGEELTPIRDYSFPFSLVVIVHPIHISTAWAFQQITPSEINRTNLLEVVQSNDLDRWKRELVNDFEEPVFAYWPQLQKTKARLLHNGAGFAALTGSGSGIYGVFERHEDAQYAAKEAVKQGCAVWCQNSPDSG